MLPPLAAAAATQPAAALMTSPEQRAALVAGPPVTAVDHRVELGGFAGIFGAARDSLRGGQMHTYHESESGKKERGVGGGIGVHGRAAEKERCTKTEYPSLGPSSNLIAHQREGK